MRSGKAHSSNVAVAFWGSNSVEVFSLHDPGASIKPSVVLSGLQSLPRSVLLQPFGNHQNDLDEAFLFAGLADGTVVAAGIKDKKLMDRRVFSLGTAPVSLSRFSVQGHNAVFASGGRSAVLSWASGSLQNSPVLVKVSCVRLPVRTLALMRYRVLPLVQHYPWMAGSRASFCRPGTTLS